MIKAVVTDLDGTVIRSDGTISAATLRAAEALRARGIPLIAATARTPLGVQSLRTLLPHLTFAVCCSGAIGVDLPTGERAWFEPLPSSAVGALVGRLSTALPDAGAAVFDGHAWLMTERYLEIRHSTHKNPFSIVPPHALTRAAACSMVVGHAELTAPELITALTGAADVTMTYAAARFVEVTAAGVDKASGVLRALRLAGVAPGSAIAFGDMPIDIPMFAAVGHSVAMAGAPSPVLAAATACTASADDDGFAHHIDNLLS